MKSQSTVFQQITKNRFLIIFGCFAFTAIVGVELVSWKHQTLARAGFAARPILRISFEERVDVREVDRVEHSTSETVEDEVSSKRNRLFNKFNTVETSIFVGCCSNANGFSYENTIKRSPEKRTATVCIRICRERGDAYVGVSELEHRCFCADEHNLASINCSLDACNHDYKALLYKLLTTGVRINDTRCGKVRLDPLQTHPITGLISFPGSGNTWIRYLIELSTGVYTGSVYLDKSLFDGGYLGEYCDPRSGQTIAVKSHKYKKSDTEMYNSTILLIRNPFKATIAEWKRHNTNNHTAEIAPEKFKNGDWDRYAKWMLTRWYLTNSVYLNANKSILVVYFENLVVDTRREMERVLDFLNLNASDFRERLDCTIEHKEGVFKRKAKKNNTSKPFDPFTKAMHKEGLEYIKKISSLLWKHKKQDLPDSYIAS